MTEKMRIEWTLLLPAIPGAHDTCVTRLSDLLRAKDGIADAHMVDADANVPGQLCVHFDPDRLSIGEVRDLARRAGAELEQRYGHLLLKSESMYARQARTIELRIGQLAGVLEAAVSPTGEIRMEFDRQATDESKIRTALQGINIRIIDVSVAIPSTAPSGTGHQSCDDKHDHEHGGLLPLHCGSRTSPKPECETHSAPVP